METSTQTIDREKLLDWAEEELSRSGIDLATAARAKIYCETDPILIGQILNYDGPAVGIPECIVYPFFHLDGSVNNFKRIKPRTPRVRRDGSTAKYLSPRNEHNRLYLPPDAIPAFAKPGVTVGITEGEKKALCVTRHALPCAAVTGVWNWVQPGGPENAERRKAGKKAERKLIPDLLEIDWRDRLVLLIPDADPRHNPAVNQAFAELGHELTQRGATVRIVKLPAGGRDDSQVHRKMAADDLVVECGADALRSVIGDNLTDQETRSLDDWRTEMRQKKLASLSRPGLYLDKSPPGSGKSFSDIQLAEAAGSSANIVPSHKNCEEGVVEYFMQDLSATAFPQLNAESCQNIDNALLAVDSGLSASSSVCLGCTFRDSCDYRSEFEAAESSPHVFLTRKRAELSEVSGYLKSRRLALIHEDPTDILCPKIVVSAARQVESVRQVFEHLDNEIRQYKLDGDEAVAIRQYANRAYRLCGEIIRSLDKVDQTSEMPLPPATAEPMTIDVRIYQTIKMTGVRPDGEAMRLIRSVVSGRADEVVVSVNQHLAPGGVPRISRSVVAVSKKQLPENAVIWLQDATANHEQIEQAIGRPVLNCTPSGRLEQRQTIVQVPLDIKRETTPGKVVQILRGVLHALPQFNRVGLIADRKHLPTILGTSKTGPHLDSDLRQRIVKTGHFRDGLSRGSNSWYRECDVLVVAGTPRVPPSAIRQHLVQIGLGFSASRPDDWTSFGFDYWLGKTASGKTQVVRCSHYRDRDWHTAYQNVVSAELIQSIGRGRAVLDDGIPVVVISTEDLGLFLAELEISPISDTESEVFRFVRDAAQRSRFLQGRDRSHSLNNNLLENVSVTTFDVARIIDRSIPATRKILSDFAERGLIQKIGERGGWVFPDRPPSLIDRGPAGATPTQPADSHTGTLPPDLEDLFS